MKFGVFDHLDNSGIPLGELYENRLRLAEACEQADIYCYHVAEHHFTPLGMSPSPSVFLSAMAQRTKRLRFGPLVYTLPLYHPLRLAEEICMLDHMSGGRLQLGVGRGVSPVELGLFGVDVGIAQSVYMESFEVIMQALTSETVTHEGTHYRYRDVPMRMGPLQKPHPPLWYGLANPEGVSWVAENAINVATLSEPGVVRQITDKYRAAWAAAGRDPASIPLMGTLRHTVVADSDERAWGIARRAYARWRANFWNLFLKFNIKPRFALYPETFDELVANGQAIVGSPQTVRKIMQSQIDASGVNYLMLDLAFGDLTLDESKRTLELLAEQVMPAMSDKAV